MASTNSTRKKYDLYSVPISKSKLTDQTILVKPIKTEEITKSGIIIPDSIVEDSRYHSLMGELIKKAPSSFQINSARMAYKPEEIPEIGDIVVFARYEGTIIVSSEDGDEYRILEDKTISMFFTPTKGE